MTQTPTEFNVKGRKMTKTETEIQTETIKIFFVVVVVAQNQSIF